MQTIELEEPVESEKEKLDIRQVCDGCGGTVPASYQAVKNDYVLYFCGHHVRRLSENLKNDGFAITPEDFSFEAQNS